MLEPNVLFENKDFIVINKPAGLLVHGVFDKHGPKHTEETLADWLLANYPEIKDVGEPLQPPLESKTLNLKSVTGP